jgi:dipeptide transport system permease protein
MTLPRRPDPLIPGDPIETLAGERGIDQARHAMLLKEFGLDRPVIVQYGIYIGRVLQGNLGKSMITQEPVLKEFFTLFPATIELATLRSCSRCCRFWRACWRPSEETRSRPWRNGLSLTGYSMPILGACRRSAVWFSLADAAGSA